MIVTKILNIFDMISNYVAEIRNLLEITKNQPKKNLHSPSLPKILAKTSQTFSKNFPQLILSRN
jgi:hypothetical protein